MDIHEHEIPKGFYECYAKKMKDKGQNSWNIEKTLPTLKTWLPVGTKVNCMGLKMIPFYAIDDMYSQIKDVNPSLLVVMKMSETMNRKAIFESLRNCAKCEHED